MPLKITSFKPRIINPMRIREVIVFSADEALRKAGKSLRNQRPWLDIRIIGDPAALSTLKTDHPCAILCDDMGMNFLDAYTFRNQNRDALLVLLTAIDLIQYSPPQASGNKYPYVHKADLIFALPRKDSALRRSLPAVVRNAEDHLNIERYSNARRYIFLVVDDEPRWTSQFLPVLYDIIGQRADVKVTRTYEETLEFLFGVQKEDQIDPSSFLNRGQGDNVVCLITDLFFPKGQNLKYNAGKELTRLLDRFYPRIPKIIASKAGEADQLSDTSFLMPKGDPGSLDTLRDYIHNYTGLGDFILFDKQGGELKRAKNIKELLNLVKAAEKDTTTGRRIRRVVDRLASRDFFSTWLYMHGFRDLGDRLIVQHNTGKRLITGLKKSLEQEIAQVEARPLIIGDREIQTLDQLLEAFQTVDPSLIQPIAATDTFSTWLDRKGYPELAEELRPIHGSGIRFEKKLVAIVEKWIGIYSKKP